MTRLAPLLLLALAACAPFETDEESARGLLGEARGQLASGADPATVRPLLDEAIALDHTNPDLYLLRAEVHRRLKLGADAEADYALAISLLKRVPEAKAELASAYLQRAVARSEGARFADGEEDFAAAIEIQPSNVEAYLHRSRVRRKKGRAQEADEDLERARKAGGAGIADAYYNAGVRELHNQRSGESERLFGIAAELEPGHVRAWLGLARCAMEGGRFATAADALSRAIEREPQSAELYYHRAIAYRAAEKWEEAFADAIRALDRDGRNPAHYVLRAAIFRLYFKDYENAERDVTQALEIDPTLPAAYLERGQLYHQMRLLNDAERDLRQSLGRRGTPEGVIALAAVLRDKGEYDKAAEALRGAIEVFPDAAVRKSLKAELERTTAAKESDR